MHWFNWIGMAPWAMVFLGTIGFFPCLYLLAAAADFVEWLGRRRAM